MHAHKQMQLVQYKASLLRGVLTENGVHDRVSNGFIQHGFKLKVTKFTKALRRILYPNNTKTISRKLLNRLGPLELAIWWMDGGSCSTKFNKNGSIRATVSTLSTCLRSKDENQIIIDWLFEKFGIKFGQRRMKGRYALICGTREGRKLRDLLAPFILPSLQYKLSK